MNYYQVIIDNTASWNRKLSGSEDDIYRDVKPGNKPSHTSNKKDCIKRTLCIKLQ